MPSPVGSFSETPNSSVALLSPASVFSMTFGCAENEICIDIRSQQMEAAHEDLFMYRRSSNAPLTQGIISAPDASRTGLHPNLIPGSHLILNFHSS